jgi:hypothetical protein
LIANGPAAARPDLSAAAAASLAAAAGAAAIRAVAPFEHGIWLVAFLFLVGFLAQLLLGRGQAALVAAADLSPPPSLVRSVQLRLWNAGVVAVPLGVLLDARLFVVAGAAALLAALISFSRTAAPALADRAGGPWLRRGYVALLVFMAASVFVGTALGWDREWL